MKWAKTLKCNSCVITRITITKANIVRPTVQCVSPNSYYLILSSLVYVYFTSTNQAWRRRKRAEEVVEMLSSCHVTAVCLTVSNTRLQSVTTHPPTGAVVKAVIQITLNLYSDAATSASSVHPFWWYIANRRSPSAGWDPLECILIRIIIL